MTSARADAIVIGGGIIGAACAYHLGLRGLRVTVVEQHLPATGTSSACSGYCAVSSKKPGLMMELARAGQALYLEAVDELGWEIDLKRGGGLILMENETERRFVATLVESVRGAGVDIRMLDYDKLRSLEPNLSDHILGAAFCPGEFTVNPFLANFAFLEAARARGAELVTRQAVTGILLGNGSVEGVRTDAMSIYAPSVVIAAGVWSRSVGELAGIDLPVVPRRGEIIVTEKTTPPTDLPLMGAGYLVAKADPDKAGESDDPLVKMGYGFMLETLPTGQALIGSTRMFVGFDRTLTVAGQRAIITQAVRRVPALARVHLLRGYAGLRPYVPDHLPIVGAVSGIKGLLVATGHEGDGITLAPITGRLIAELVSDGTPSIPIDKLSPDRFQERGSAE